MADSYDIRIDKHRNRRAALTIDRAPTCKPALIRPALDTTSGVSGPVAMTPLSPVIHGWKPDLNTVFFFNC